METTVFDLFTRGPKGRLRKRTIDTVQWAEIIRKQGVSEFGRKWGRLFKRYLSRCEAFHSGRNRATFVFRNHVVKLPINFGGLGDNDWEGSVSNGPDQDDRYSIQYARTRLYYVGELPVLFMERVTPAGSVEIENRLGFEPEWVYSVDCGQVGFNKSGRLVAYDYGYN